jgi:hypothetical protein
MISWMSLMLSVAIFATSGHIATAEAKQPISGIPAQLSMKSEQDPGSPCAPGVTSGFFGQASSVDLTVAPPLTVQ